MKLLHREDVLEAGHDLPTTGLCANIGPTEMEELKFGGEWILAEDETLVADGHEQRFLYMVVMGEVGIFKANDQGKNQHIATLGKGAAFGEMAFLSGGVASASVQAVGECILWRLDHERLIEFIGEHGAAGGQLMSQCGQHSFGAISRGKWEGGGYGKRVTGISCCNSNRWHRRILRKIRLLGKCRGRFPICKMHLREAL